MPAQVATPLRLAGSLIAILPVRANLKLFGDATAEREVQRERSGEWREPPTSHVTQLEVLAKVGTNRGVKHRNHDSHH
jgi:hypothetical protein